MSRIDVKDEEMRFMKIAMAQMCMSNDIKLNAEKALQLCDIAKGSDLLFFPEIQLTPFFPQYPAMNADMYVTRTDDEFISHLQKKALLNHMYISPNLYIEENGKRYDCSLWITPEGEIKDTASMVHIYQGEYFYEQDYYTPSEDGFKVFNTPFGKVGIVICFDRHLPESIRTCALRGADLVIIPTANTKDEPLDLFEWEIRVQAMQNAVFIAMCNRVGKEDEMLFAGESLIADPEGGLIIKGSEREEFITAEIDLEQAKKEKAKRTWLNLRRPALYE